MTVMQTTALKINGIPKLQWVIISVISIDQRRHCVEFPFLLVEQCRDTWQCWRRVCVCLQMKFNHKAVCLYGGFFFPRGDLNQNI